MRSRLLITGASGGLGRACARLLGATHDLVLTDIAAGPLDRFADELRGDGYGVVATHAGDLGGDALVAALVADLSGEAPLKMVHAAGIAPSHGDWRAIIDVNLVTTAKLLRAIEPLLRSGSAAVLMASIAGHVLPPLPDLAALLDRPLDADLLARLEPIVAAFAAEAGPVGACGVAYMMSKHGVIRLCEARAAAWGAKGARIVSISPGVIMTPMGRKELADTPGTAEARDRAPAGRAGMPMDIAIAARFLLSDAASFVTGTDLRIDGGTVAAQRNEASASPAPGGTHHRERF